MLQWRTFWTIGLAGLITLPIFIILFQLLGPATDTWTHLRSTVLSDYLWNTFYLLIGCAALTSILGISAAWLVSTFEFPGRRVIEWLLVLPLAIPTYIVAFAYVGLLDYTGPIQTFTRNTLKWRTDALIPFDIMSLGGAILVISLVLYPYVYLIVRASFMRQSRAMLEASWTLGQRSWRTFFRVALPAIRPAWIGGVSLVIMEVLNDYGAVKYYGIPTFTTGIFRAWFSMGDLTAAIRLSAFLLFFVGILLALEYWQRREKSFANSVRERPLARMKLKGGKLGLAYLILAIPIVLGFVLPNLQLLLWAARNGQSFDLIEFSDTLQNSLLVALMTAAIAVLIAFLLGFSRQEGLPKVGRWLGRMATLGYVIPGAVIAIGVMTGLGYVQQWESLKGILLVGSLGALVYACLVRFLAVAANAVDAGYEQINPRLRQVSSVLGAKAWRRLWSIDRPLLNASLLAALMLVLVDVMKELPLTLIMRPFNFDTLATKAFELAHDEQLEVAAVYALTIVLVSLGPIIWLNRLMENKQ